MAPSSAVPCPCLSISFGFRFPLCSPSHPLYTAVLLPPAASPVHPLTSLRGVSFVSFPCLCSLEEAPPPRCPSSLPLGLTYPTYYCNCSPPLHHQGHCTSSYSSLTKTKPDTKGRPESEEPQQAGNNMPAAEQKQRHKPRRRQWATSLLLEVLGGGLDKSAATLALQREVQL